MDGQNFIDSLIRDRAIIPCRKLIDLMGESMTGRMPVPQEKLNLVQTKIYRLPDYRLITDFYSVLKKDGYYFSSFSDN
ncbi:MAG: hypothetical protein F6J96_26065 [Symploca sp. SIO1C2]|nr:hypothetical protein [Symploca sp. SIO1C2]